MTAPRPHVGRLPRLHSGVVRWLLGARCKWIYPDGYSTHGAITRYRFLFWEGRHTCTSESWDAHLAELWETYGPAVTAWHLKRWPDKRPPRTPQEAALAFERRRRAQHRPKRRRPASARRKGYAAAACEVGNI
jgi:hypothetical protein